MRKTDLVRVLTRARTGPPARSLSSSPSPNNDVALKNVTKSNFEAALAKLRRHVTEADFVSIDLEMTGLTSAPWRETFEFDRPDIQYLKIKDSAEKFAVVQFGVCPFRWDSHSNCFVAHPHNFYIFPRQEISGDGLSYEFLCQTGSLEFLAKYQFDFNTCIYEGISYLSRSQEVEAFKRLDLVYKDELPDSSSSLRKGVDTKLVRMADILFAERIKNIVSDWRIGLLRGRNSKSEFQGSPSDINLKFQTTFFQMRPALAVNGFTSRQLKLVKLVTDKHFKDLAYVHLSGTSLPQTLIGYTDSTTDRDLLMSQVKACQRKEAETKIKAAIGFRHVIDLLSSERKLIVGHNCFLDLAHVYSKFISPLPSNAKEFVAAVQSYFPYIIDTKLLLNLDDTLWSIMKKGSTSLSKAFGILCPPINPSGRSTGLTDKSRVKVEVEVDDQRFSNWNSGAKHEAGYDAFMTGCVFSQTCIHLGIKFNSEPQSIDFLLHNEKLQKYINQLYLSWINGDIIDLKTGKNPAESLGFTVIKRRHPKIVFSNMILLWGPPSKLRVNDIRACFCKTFGEGSVAMICHLDETAAFVQFSRPELLSDFIELKKTLERDNGPISILYSLSTILGDGGVKAESYEMYKEICASSVSEVLFADQAEVVGNKWRGRIMVDEDIEGEKVEGCEISDFPFCQEQENRSIGSSVAESELSSNLTNDDEVLDCLYPSEAQSGK